MLKIIQIALTDLRVYLSDRMNVFSLTLMPVVLAVILGLVFNQNSTPGRIRLDVIDEDGSATSAQFLVDLRAANDSLRLCGVDTSVTEECGLEIGVVLTAEAAIERVQNDDTSALLIIPAGFGAAQEALTPISLPYYSLADMTTGDAALTAVQAVLQRANGASIAAQVAAGMGDRIAGGLFADEAARSEFAWLAYDNAVELWQNQSVVVEYRVAQQAVDESKPPASGFSQSVPGMATMYVMITVLGGISLMLQERKQWTLQRLVMMPITRAQRLAGKILARCTTGIIQFAILFAVGMVVGLDFGKNIPALLVIMVVYTLCVTALAFALAPMIRTEGQAGSLITMLSLVLAALGGAWWPLEIVPDFMQTIGHLSPVAWAMDSFNSLLFYGGGLVEILPNMALLAAVTVVLFVIGIARFKYD